MSDLFSIHPQNPQRRLLRRAADVARSGGVLVYPTDSCYALGCMLGCSPALRRIVRIRQLEKGHMFSILCRDLSDISTYANIDRSDYRLLKSKTPGPYTFVLQASRQVPRSVLQSERRSIGIRIPDDLVLQGLLEELGAPLLSSSLILPHKKQPETDAEQIYQRLQKSVDIVLDGGVRGQNLTTIIHWLDGRPQVARPGLGVEEVRQILDENPTDLAG